MFEARQQRPESTRETKSAGTKTVLRSGNQWDEVSVAACIALLRHTKCAGGYLRASEGGPHFYMYMCAGGRGGGGICVV